MAGITGAIFGVIRLIPLFMRDHEKRLYSPTLFYLVATVYKIPLFIFLTGVYIVIVVLILDVDSGENYEKTLNYFFILSLTYISSYGIGDAVSIML